MRTITITLLLLAAALAGCDSRGERVEECVAAMKRSQERAIAANPYAAPDMQQPPAYGRRDDEGSWNLACMRAAYGNAQHQ